MRLLTAALAGAALLVPAGAGAATIPYLSHGEGVSSDAVAGALAAERAVAIPYLSHGEGVSADAVAAQLGSERAWGPTPRAGGPDGFVASEPTLRRDAPDGFVSQPYVTGSEQPSTPTTVADSGWNLDWTALGIGAGMGLLLAALLAGGAAFAARGRFAKA